MIMSDHEEPRRLVQVLATELLAWLISQRVACKMGSRMNCDWEVAVNYFQAHPDAIAYIARNCSFGIPREKFNDRFTEYLNQRVTEMLSDKDRWFPEDRYVHS